MDKKLISVAADGHQDKIVEIVRSISDHELQQFINDRAVKGKGDPLEFIRAVLLGSSDEQNRLSRTAVQVYKICAELLEKNEMQNKLSSDLIGLLMIQVDSLSNTAVVDIATVYIDMVKGGQIQSGRSLELLPKVMSALAAMETVVHAGGSMKGEEFRNHVHNSLCSSKWNPRNVIHLAAMFKDIDMSPAELKFVIEKILRSFKDIDLQDLPALVYQLLLLSTKGNKKDVMEGIMIFFLDQDQQHKGYNENELSEDLMNEDQDVDVLRHTEGTVILHIMFAVKQDQELGREFIKLLKSNQNRSASQVLSPFTLALALSLARIHRFEDQIYDFLKATVLKSYKDAGKQSESHWVRDIIQDQCHTEDYALETIKNSKYGWDQVIQGLVQFGFLLMDSFGPKPIFGRIDTSLVPHTGPNHQACKLGSKILLNTFKEHEMVRAEILDQIFTRVLTKATTPVSHFMDLLSNAVLSAPQIVLESTPKVREMLDYLSFLPPESADALLGALHPLLKLSLTLKESLILILRKSMFSRILDARKIGLKGFLLILKHFKVLGGLASSQSSQSFSSSQVQIDVHAKYNQASNEALCLEIVGNLRRVLSQQADVRLILYEGLYDVLCRNTKLIGPVLDLLRSQFKKYYEPSEDVNPPFKLDLCIASQGDKVYLEEPLSHLIFCIQLCVIKVIEIQRQSDEEEEDVTQSFTELQQILESLTKQMSQCEIEDFELDKSADFSLTSSVGVKNNIFAILVMGSYEALIEFTFRTGDKRQNTCEEILQLFGNYTKVYDILKEKNNQNGGKKSSSSKPPQSLMSLHCVSNLLQSMFDAPPQDNGKFSDLYDDQPFCMYVLNVAVQKVHQIQENGYCSGPKGREKNHMNECACQLGRLFLKYYTENQRGDQQQRQVKVMSGLCLDGLSSVVTIVTQQYSNQLLKCFCSISDTEHGDISRTNQDKIIYDIVRKFQKLTMNILTSGAEHKNWKEVTSLFSIVHQLCKQLNSTKEEYEKVTNWILKLCQEQEIEDVPTCKLMLSILIDMTRQMKSCSPLLRELSQDVHSQLGDIDQEVEVEDRTHFAILTPRTAAPTGVLLVLSSMEKDLDDTDWVINRLKADILAEAAMEKDEDKCDLTQREGHEKSVCTRLCVIVTAFHELVQSAVPVGSCTDSMVKLVTRVFSTITMLVKFYLSMYNSKAGHVSARFEKLVKLVGTHLTPYVYSMITYVQTSENEDIQQKMEKGKKGKAGKGKKNTVSQSAAQAGSAKVMKQSRTTPNLIFAIETFEKFLIQLTKKSKMNLMEYIKNSTSRDFRINVAALQNQSESDDEEEDEPMEEEGNNHEEVMEVQGEEESD